MLSTLQREAVQARRVGPAPRASGTTTIFEHRGVGTLTLVGPVTGRRYGFVGYGARVEVDARDRAALRASTVLRELPGR
jgi:hypothetical protein